MNDKDNSENKNEADSPLEQETDSPVDQGEEIIFPKKDENRPTVSIKNSRVKFSLLKVFGVILLAVGVYFGGYLTSPENFTGTMNQFKEWLSASKEKIAPYQEKLTQAIESKIKKKPPGNQKTTSSKANQPKRKVKYWQAPMNPTYVRDKPGKSPMGMDLVPIYEDESEVAGQIKISPTVVQNIGVKTVKVKRRTLARKIRTVGTLTYDERLVYHIHTKYEGWIEKLHVNFTGQEVEQDEMLLEIYSPELVSTQEEFLLALKYQESLKESPFIEIGEAADTLLKSTHKRLQLLDVPEHQIEALVRDKKITKTMHIHSPVRGFVIKKNALQGMRVKPGMSLYMIADLSNIWVMADIYEYELPWVKLGQKVEMNLSYFPGKKFVGKVTYINPFLDAKTRTNKVRMEFANPNWKLKPDMYANVIIKSTIAKRGVAVPEEAVIHSGEREIVIIRGPNGTFESRELTLGPQADGYYQVLKGLRAGETVVTSSNFLIDSESNLKEALSKLQPDKKGKSAKTPTRRKKMDMPKMDHEKM